jgi:hypothetical protein
VRGRDEGLEGFRQADRAGSCFGGHRCDFRKVRSDLSTRFWRLARVKASYNINFEVYEVEVGVDLFSDLGRARTKRPNLGIRHRGSGLSSQQHLCICATIDRVDTSPRLLLSLDKLLDEPYKLFRLLRMHPMTRIERLQTHVREKPSSDRFVTFGNVPRLGPLDEQCRAFPCGFAGSVGEVADSGDGGGEDVKRDSKFKGFGLGVDKAVCEEELADGEFL